MNSSSWYKSLLVIICIILLNSIIYFPSIGGFFLADDFIHLAYLHKVFHGNLDLLLNNFLGNWMQATATQFYRPLISISLAFDYLLWGNRPLGYHLSNLAFHIIAAILFYFLVRRMMIKLGKEQADWIAFCSAMFFSCYPLHPEVVSWVIGRVDSIATGFYLGAFLLFLRWWQSSPKKDWFRSADFYFSLFLYLGGMLSKEIAVTLPAAIFFWLIVTEEGGWKREDETVLKQKLIGAVKSTLPYWIIFLGYLVIRANVLGTVSGGYSGSLGEALNSSLSKRFAVEQLMRLLLPFNDQLFPAKEFLRISLKYLYILAGVFLVIRLFSKRFYALPWKFILFALLWFAASLLPTYQVFDLTTNLQGTRIIYLASLPLCLLLALVLLPLRSGTENGARSIKRTFISSSSYAICIALISTYALINYRNNLPWRSAGDEVRALQNALAGALSSMGPNYKLILLNLPSEYKGAHMLYNASMLSTLLSEPLSKQNLSKRVITFEPVLYGQSELLNFARLKRYLADGQHYMVAAWQRKAEGGGYLRLIKTNRTIKSSENMLDLKVPSGQLVDSDQFEFLASPELNISPLQYDLLEIVVQAEKQEEIDKSEKEKVNDGWLSLEWLSLNNFLPQTTSILHPVKLDGQPHKMLINLSEHKNWLMAEYITQLRVHALASGTRFRLLKVRLLNAQAVIPEFSLHPDLARDEDEMGICHIRQIDKLCFRYDASKIPGAQAVVYEISKPNFWFEHEWSTFTSNNFSTNTVLKKRIDQLKGEIIFSAVNLQPAYYEIHLVAVDKKGSIVGLMSYPLCIQVSDAGPK